MSKCRTIAAILFVIAGLFVIGFGLLLWKDYTVHDPYGSAPFYLYVIERVLELLVPAVLCFAAGRIINRRAEKRRK